MDTATLAMHESKFVGRQRLRRRRRTIYIRTYDIPWSATAIPPVESNLPLPDSGDFLPGETSGACVTADGVTIQPVNTREFSGLRVTVVAQEPVYNNIDTDPSTFDLGAYFVEASPSDSGGQTETSVGNSQYNRWRFEVPAASWSGLTNIPNKGATTPSAIGGSGTVLSKVVDRDSVPGFVVCELVTGYTWSYFEPITKISSRTVTVKKKAKFGKGSDSATALSGWVFAQAGKQRYAVDGEDADEETYVQITVTSIVDSIDSAWAGTNVGKVNSSQVSFDGVTYPAGYVRYDGGASSDAAGPSGSGQHRIVLQFTAAPQAWPTAVTRYVEKKTVVRLPVVDQSDLTTTIGHTNSTQWLPDVTTATSVTIRESFDMATPLGNLP